MVMVRWSERTIAPKGHCSELSISVIFNPNPYYKPNPNPNPNPYNGAIAPRTNDPVE